MVGFGFGFVFWGRGLLVRGAVRVETYQSKSTTDHDLVDSGEVKPLLLHGMMSVERFITYVGGRAGTCARTAVVRRLEITFFMGKSERVRVAWFYFYLLVQKR